MNIVEKNIAEFNEKCMNYPSYVDYDNTYYHFTDLSALRSILKNRELRFTYYEDLNDKLEIEYGMDIFRDCVRKGFQENIYRYFNLLLSEFLKTDRDCMRKNNLNIFICSFSKSFEHLPVWRFYGDNGYGVAIGFDPNMHLDNFENIPNYQIPIRSNVIYGAKKLRAEINTKISEIKKIIHLKEFRKARSEEQDEYFRKLCVPLISYILGCAASFKHEDYEAEDEARMLLLDGWRRDLLGFPDGCNFDYFEESKEATYWGINPDNKQMKERKKTYVNMPKFNKQAVKSIILGSRCEYDTENIKDLLFEMGYSNIKVIRYNSSFVG